MATTVTNPALNVKVSMAAQQYTGNNAQQLNKWLKQQQPANNQIYWLEGTNYGNPGATLALYNSVADVAASITPGCYVIVLTHPTLPAPVVVYATPQQFKEYYM